MKLAVQLKLLPTETEAKLLDATAKQYITLINEILYCAIACDEMPKLSSSKLKAPLPSALKDQCRLDAKSIYDKVTKPGSKHNGKFPLLKKPVIVWNNQNYTVGKDYIAMPFFVDGKSRKMKIAAIVPDEVFEILSTSKRGTLRITKKGNKYIAQIAYEKAEAPLMDGQAIMGVDLGIKCPAVSVTSNSKTKFYGNGRQNKFVRRRYAKRRKMLGKAKKQKAICKSRNKEQRWMTDQDHKISRSIVNEAIKQNVSTIKLESLSGIRQTTRTSRKNNHSFHNWSFYRMAMFIEYKARLAGINVVYVNPAYTSQTCPQCGEKHHAKDRLYVCPKCGFHGHRDRIGALNILNA